MDTTVMDNTLACESDEIDDEDSDIFDDSSVMSDSFNDNWEESIVEDISSISCAKQYNVHTSDSYYKYGREIFYDALFLLTR
jgi:hypothetical protein